MGLGYALAQSEDFKKRFSLVFTRKHQYAVTLEEQHGDFLGIYGTSSYLERTGVQEHSKKRRKAETWSQSPLTLAMSSC